MVLVKLSCQESKWDGLLYLLTVECCPMKFLASDLSDKNWEKVKLCKFGW